MLEPGQTFDRYTVEATLGEGGMASVFRVRHTTLGSLHALKVLHVQGPGIRERLLAEGRVQAGLDHPNALVVSDVIDVDGAPGLIMEYVAGGSLEEWVDTSPTRAERLDVFRAVCEAVASAHQSGWIHRDLKPANVLLKRVGNTVMPKVADFGLVKALSGVQPHNGPRTRDGATMGSPGYMAPEQIENAAEVDARADVYSLGCVLIWVLTGERAVQGETVLEMFAEVAAGRYRSLPAGDPLQPVVDRCLAHRAEDRYPDAQGICDALEALASAPSTAVPARAGPGTAASLIVLAGVLGLGALALVAVLGVAVFTLGWGGSPVPPEKAAAVVVEAPIKVPGCPASGKIGWVRGGLSGLEVIPNPYTLPTSAAVYERANQSSAVICTLPPGTRVPWTNKYRRTFGDFFYVEVDAEKLVAP